MNSPQSILFSPFRLGPVNLRNRTVRAAAFEGMCPGNKPMASCIQNEENVKAEIKKMLH